MVVVEHGGYYIGHGELRLVAVCSEVVDIYWASPSASIGNAAVCDCLMQAAATSQEHDRWTIGVAWSICSAACRTGWYACCHVC